MGRPDSPREVFLALVNGVAEGRWEELPGLYAEQTHVVHPFDPLRGPALRTRDELREHFRPTGAGPRLDTGEAFAQPGIFVLRVRNGEIVSSRDYFDHVTTAGIRGQLDALVAAIKARRAAVT